MLLLQCVEHIKVVSQPSHPFQVGSSLSAYHFPQLDRLVYVQTGTPLLLI